jgi:hypothetical protein
MAENGRWRPRMKAVTHELLKVLALGGVAWSCGDPRSVLAAFGEELTEPEPRAPRHREVDVRREVAAGMVALETYLAAHDRPPSR